MKQPKWLLMPFTKQIRRKYEKLTEKITQFIENFKNVHAEARKIGFAGIMNLLWKDLFVGRSLFQWLYLIFLSSVPLILEFTQNTESHDWMSLFASWTGIVCVILVAEGRASNYLLGPLTLLSIWFGHECNFLW